MSLDRKLTVLILSNIIAVYSATSSVYFNSRDSDDTLIAGLHNFILATALIAIVYFVYEDVRLLTLLMLINLLLFTVYFDMATGKIGIWDWLLHQFNIKPRSDLEAG